MTDQATPPAAGDPTATPGDPSAEEIAAALVAVRRFLQQQRGHGGAAVSRWLRAGRVEAIMPSPRGAAWSTAERPR